MARYNSALASTTITGTHTISSPSQGAFTNLAGTAPYTVTLPAPTLFPGSNQTFYNATGGTITLSTPSGILTGTGGSNASTVACFAGNVLSVTSDGTNYVVISEDGSALVATTGSFSGDVTMNGSSATVLLTPTTVTIAPINTSNINNMNIGASTRGSGAFTSLTANAATTFTANTASSSTGTGSLVVTGGVGVSGQVTATSVSATNLVGTVQTASQPNITSVGTLSSLNVTGSTSLTGQLTVTNVEADIWLTNTGGGAGTWRILGSSGTTTRVFRVYDHTNGTDRLTIDATGNVGIGVGIAPQQKLDISGNIRLSGSFYRPDNAGIAATLGNGTNTFYAATHAFQNASGSTNLVTVNGTGLGINTTPSHPLHVSGGKVWFNNASGDTGTRAAGLTVSVNPGATYSPGTDPGDTVRAMSIIAGTGSSYPAILGFRNITAGTSQQMVDLVLDPNANKFFISRPGVTPWLSFSNTSHDINSSRGFRNWTKTHSTTNGSAGSGSPTTTNITQISDNMYEYGFYFFASTGGYPTCPNSYWVMCPVQKQDSGGLAWAEVTIRGVHRGMWGASGYDEYASIVVGTASDGGGFWVKEWRNGNANDSSNRIRAGWMNFDGVYQEGSNYNTGFNLAGITGNTIGNSYYKMPLFLKIYTNCGADKEYQVTVRTNNPDVLGPPFKGPMWLSPNVNPTSSIYW